jgi:hypothetical protein
MNAGAVARPTESTGSTVWALLVGIDEYLAQTNLRGCVNDVEAMRVFLVNQLDVPEDHIRTITNEQATRANILAAFQEFLIENPAIARGDQILFHYSGHGSRMRDATGVEPDGYNETLVAHDSRTKGIYDIPDKTIAVLLDRLAAQKGDHITVILDSCHSGSGTRKAHSPGAALTRRVPSDDRLPPSDLDAELHVATPTRGAGPSGWSLEGIPYVLVAGCRDREESNEYWAKDTEQSGTWHGALTYFTLQALADGTAVDTTYSELHERVAARVNAVYPSQMPQCEGDRDRIVFGGARVQRDPFIPVRKVDGNIVTLSAGLVHGLRKDAVVALYPPEVRTRAELPAEPLAVVNVVSVSATTAQAEIEGAPAAPIPLHARGVVIRHVYAGLRQTVALQAADGTDNAAAIELLRQAILHAGPGGEPSSYLEIVDDPQRPAELLVEAAGGTLSINNANGELLVVPEDIQDRDRTDAVAVLHALETIARFRLILDLRNQEAGSQLSGKVRLRLRRHVPDAADLPAEDLPPGSISPGGETTVSVDPDLPERNLYIVDVINESPLPVYPHLFTLSPDFSVQRLYPNLGQEEALPPGGTLSAGLNSPTERLEFYLPEGWDSSRDYIKVVVTTAPTDMRAVQQDGLDVPLPTRAATRSGASSLEQLLDAVLYGAGTRAIRPYRPGDQEDWTTVELPVTSVRAYQTVTIQPEEGRVALSDGLVLESPAGFHGRATVTTWGQATRGAQADPNLKPPPGLDNQPALFQPVHCSGTRGLGSPGLVVTLEVDADSRQRITPENPLRLELPIDANEDVADLLPVVFDGEDYLLVGYQSDDPGVVHIVTLPPAVAPVDARAEPARRGIGRTLKLFLYKKMGRRTTLTGLRSAELRNGDVTYAEIDRAHVRSGHKVALFIHDFSADTRWMIGGPAKWLREKVVPYDHLLAWDYETFGTSVEESGARLADALRQQCGLNPDDGVVLHVYAHGMGSLVARCMIELSGGHVYVDRLVMAGPPNRGTTLATTSRGLVYVVSALINQFSIVPPVGAVDWVFKQIYQQGVGLADLAVDAPILTRINRLDEPHNVPYLVLAGENLPDEEARRRLNRLARKVLDQTLDAVFGEQNDVVVGVSSMREVRGGAYPRLTVTNLPCDHFHYFSVPQGLEAIRRWITA